MADIDFYMNPEIMDMCNDLNIEYSRFCGIMAILVSIPAPVKGATEKPQQWTSVHLTFQFLPP